MLPKGTVSRLRWLREGSQVERTHTVRHIGNYSVGEHSHGMCVLLLALHPNPSLSLLKAATLHDLHEVHTGDIPVFAKTTDFRRVEDNVTRLLGIEVELTQEERTWLRAVDSLDLYLWCLEQKEMGNRNVARIEESVRGVLLSPVQQFPDPVLEVVRRYSAERSWPIGAK